MQRIPNATFSPNTESMGSVLHYLEAELPGYQFEARIDMPFVLELLTDFPEIDILEKIKNFRWYHDNIPFSRNGSQRVSIRRWIAHTAARLRYPHRYRRSIETSFRSRSSR